jgi:hypothetical protein
LGSRMIIQQGFIRQAGLGLSWKIPTTIKSLLSVSRNARGRDCIIRMRHSPGWKVSFA